MYAAADRRRKPKIRCVLLAALIALVLVLACTLELESVPPVWWDEGWTMMVARNWVEDGFYGRYLAGEPSPPGLEGHYPVVASVALSFRCLGVGLWQARLPGAMYTLGAIGLAFYLAYKLYGLDAAWGTLAVLLFFIGRPEINPLMIGRQVLGDMPVIFFLLAGYTAILLSVQVSWLILALAAFFWGLALATKSQTLPFWLLAVAAPLGWLAWRRERKRPLIVAAIGLGSWFVYQGILALKQWVLLNHTLPPEVLSGLFSVNAFILDRALRLRSVQTALSFSLICVLGLIYYLSSFFHQITRKSAGAPPDLVRFSLWVLAGSWLGWYLLFSNAGNRYLSVPAFLSSIFAGSMLVRLTGSFSLKETVRRCALMLFNRRINQDGLGAFMALVLFAIAVPSTAVTYLSFWMGKDVSARELAQVINRSVPQDSLIESYDSELLFYLDRKYHFPPDPVHVELLHRYLLGSEELIDYDPLAADPDYLVVGEVSRDWKLYQDSIEAGHFRLLKDEGRYQFYERIR